MNGPKRFLVVIFLLIIASTIVAAQDPQTYFEQNCSSCHTIGGGASVGPDLKNVTHRAPRHWLVEFIRDPDSKIAAKDPYAAKLVAEAQGVVMTGSPDVSEEFGEELLEYIDRKSAGRASSASGTASGDVVSGRALFLGKRRLSNGAAACVACHQASGLPLTGGKLGPDLSAAHIKLGGDRGLISWLRNPTTKVMSSVFRPAPLTEEEAADLTAFLRSASENPTRLAQAPLRNVQMIGLAGSLLAFVIAGVIWRGRLRGVRQQIITSRGEQ